MRGRRKAGTSIRRELDMVNIGEGLARPGMDTRTWVSWGTVASVGGEDGKPDFSDPNAVVITSKGVDVDVILEPEGVPVTCTYGTQAGDCFILTPIRPGDQVMVVIPEGEYGAVPAIVKVMAGPHTPLPLEDDRKPVFKNDRLHIFAKTVPIEIRTQGGARVRLTQDQHVEVVGQLVALGSAEATEQAVLGTTQRSAESTLDTAFQTFLGVLTTYAAAIQSIADPSGLATTALTTGITALTTAISTYEVQGPQFLSNTVKVKE